MDSDSGSDYGGEAPHYPRDLPNILITGTPGTGKTTTSEMAAEATGLTHINVGDLVKAKALHEGLDKEYDTYILDEDKVGQLSWDSCIIIFHESQELGPKTDCFSHLMFFPLRHATSLLTKWRIW